MQPSLFDPDQPLPSFLQDELAELLSWDNNCFLTWARGEADAALEALRTFTVRLSCDGERFGLRLEYWIPEWMDERGVAAILPAHMTVEACSRGESASVDLGMRFWGDLRRSLPKVARTCARLMNELWGPTTSGDVLRIAIGYQEEQLETAFAALRDRTGA